MNRAEATSVSTLLLALLITLPLAGQTDDLPPFGEVVRVNVVNVEVTVVDRKGNPIRGLTIEDFELFEDGRPVDIFHLSFIEGGIEQAPGPGPLSAAKRADRRPAPPPSPSGDSLSMSTLGPGSEPESAEPVWMVIWVDNIHSRMHDRNRALDQIETLIRTELASQDQVLVASYYRSLRTEQVFTRDRDSIARALEALKRTPAEGVANDRERRRFIRLVESAPSAKDAVETVRPYAGHVRGELWGTLLALEKTIEELAGLPGRKSILYVSSGLPLKPGAVHWNAIEYKWPRELGIHELHLFDQTSEFQKLAARASASGVQLHTLDASGVRAPNSSLAEGELHRVPTMSANLDTVEHTNHQLPLRQLADSTGGRAILNRNDASDALEQLARELHTYYSLGFTPTRADDDRFHRLKVRVRAKGARLRYREGYRDKTPSIRMAEQLRSTLAHGLEENPLDLGILVHSARSSDSDRFEVPVQVTLPVRSLAFHPGPSGHRSSFRLYLAVMDESGAMSDVLEIPASLELDDTERQSASSAIWRMTRQLKLRGGRQRLAVGVRDELSLLSAFAAKAIDLRADPGSSGTPD